MVALVEEGVELREAGIDAPILVLSEPAAEAADAVVAHRLTPVVYTAAGIDALAKAVADRGAPEPLPVHLKVDTGMHRVGAAPEDAVALAHAGRRAHRAASSKASARTSRWPTSPTTRTPASSSRGSDAVLAELDAAGVRPPLVHAANSAGLLAFPRRALRPRAGGHRDLRRPARARRSADRAALRPALVAEGARLAREGARRRRARLVRAPVRARRDAGRVATVPIGYADGVPRNLAAVGGEVLVRRAAPSRSPAR